MSWLQEHAQRISDWQQRAVERNKNWIPKGFRSGSAPGSAQSLVDAIAADRWSRPYGGEPNSMDIYMGGGSATNPGSQGRWTRGIGRGIGTIAALWAAGAGLGGGGGAETGAGESFGLTGMEGAGGAEAVPWGGEGAAYSESGRAPWVSWAQRGARQMMRNGGLGSMLGGLGGGQQAPSGGYGPPIQPIQTYRDPLAQNQSIPPGLMALLLQQAMQRQAEQQQDPDFSLGSTGLA